MVEKGVGRDKRSSPKAEALQVILKLREGTRNESLERDGVGERYRTKLTEIEMIVSNVGTRQKVCSNTPCSDSHNLSCLPLELRLTHSVTRSCQCGAWYVQCQRIMDYCNYMILSKP